MAEQAFEHLPVAAFMVKKNKILLAINEEARRLTSASPDAVGRETCRALWNCGMPENRCPLRKAFSRRDPVRKAKITVFLSQRKQTFLEHITIMRTPRGGERRAVITCGNATGYFRRIHKLNEAVRIDSLTRLLNRGYFENSLSRWLQTEHRKRNAAFVMIDVDGLKRVNDQEGHASGDRLLRRLGRLLRRQTRRCDRVGRLGGDEFGIFCPNTDRIEARKLIRRLRSAVKRENAKTPQATPLSIGIGVSFLGNGGTNLREEADRRLLQYKERQHRSSNAGPARVLGSRAVPLRHDSA